MNHPVYFNRASSNSKLSTAGNVAVINSPIETSCPDSCALKAPQQSAKRGPCYAQHGHQGMLQTRISTNRVPLIDATTELPNHISTLHPNTTAGIRDRVGGDQYHNPKTGNMLARPLRALDRAAKKRRVPLWGYTHHKPNGHNRTLLLSLSHGVYSFSVDKLSDAFKLKAKHRANNFVSIVPSAEGRKTWKDPATGIQAVVCPNHWDATITCADRCKMCLKPRDYIVVFPIHGAGKRTGDIIATDGVA